MRYYLVAGERSGDLHAGNLVKALKKNDPSSQFRGFGGEYMREAGVELTVHYDDLAFMGLAEVVTNAGKIRKYIALCKKDILAYNPDVIILIDYGGFNLAIARFGKKNGYTIFYYIPPKYWAWYPGRAAWLKPHVDRLYVILPFEKEFFKKFDWEATYVGNPVLDAVKEHLAQNSGTADSVSSTHTRTIALLPGSRTQELKRIIPLMAKVVKKFPDHKFAVAAVNNVDASWYDELRGHANVELVFENTYNILLNSDAAIVTSGTATLETALFKIPQIVVYKASTVSYWLARFLVKIEFISLVNLIAGKQVVMELIQSEASEENVAKELSRLISDTGYRANMINGYEEIIQKLDTGSASQNAAMLMIKDLKGIVK